MTLWIWLKFFTGIGKKIHISCHLIFISMVIVVNSLQNCHKWDDWSKPVIFLNCIQWLYFHLIFSISSPLQRCFCWLMQCCLILNFWISVCHQSSVSVNCTCMLQLMENFDIYFNQESSIYILWFYANLGSTEICCKKMIIFCTCMSLSIKQDMFLLFLTLYRL